MDPYRYRLVQRLKDGSIWRQPDGDCGEGQLHHIKQAVIAGYLMGEPRWAETTDTGFFIFGLDRVGKEHGTGTACPDFSE